MSKLPRNQLAAGLQEVVDTLTREKEQNAGTIDYLRGQIEHADDRIAALWDRAQQAEQAADHWAEQARRKDALIADLMRRTNLAVNLQDDVSDTSAHGPA